MSGNRCENSYNPLIAAPPSAWTDLPAAASSAGEARRFVKAALERWDLDVLCEAATLLVSELVSNAVLHAGTAVRVRVRRDGSRVRVEVHDGDRRAPARKHYSSMATTGRGLLLVERLSSGWGVEASDSGKQVWFELDSARRPAEEAMAFDLDLDLFDDLDLGFDGPVRRGDEPEVRGPRALASCGLR